jgi:hypothetical protein
MSEMKKGNRLLFNPSELYYYLIFKCINLQPNKLNTVFIAFMYKQDTDKTIFMNTLILDI